MDGHCCLLIFFSSLPLSRTACATSLVIHNHIHSMLFVLFLWRTKPRKSVVIAVDFVWEQSRLIIARKPWKRNVAACRSSFCSTSLVFLRVISSRLLFSSRPNLNYDSFLCVSLCRLFWLSSLTHICLAVFFAFSLRVFDFSCLRTSSAAATAARLDRLITFQMLDNSRNGMNQVYLPVSKRKPSTLKEDE